MLVAQMAQHLLSALDSTGLCSVARMFVLSSRTGGIDTRMLVSRGRRASAPYWHIHYMTLETSCRASSEPAAAELVEVEVHHERQRVQRLRTTRATLSVFSTAGAAFVVGSSTLRATRRAVQRVRPLTRRRVRRVLVSTARNEGNRRAQHQPCID